MTTDNSLKEPSDMYVYHSNRRRTSRPVNMIWCTCDSPFLILSISTVSLTENDISQDTNSIDFVENQTRAVYVNEIIYFSVTLITITMNYMVWLADIYYTYIVYLSN